LPAEPTTMSRSPVTAHRWLLATDRRWRSDASSHTAGTRRPIAEVFTPPRGSLASDLRREYAGDDPAAARCRRRLRTAERVPVVWRCNPDSAWHITERRHQG